MGRGPAHVTFEGRNKNYNWHSQSWSVLPIGVILTLGLIEVRVLEVSGKKGVNFILLIIALNDRVIHSWVSSHLKDAPSLSVSNIVADPSLRLPRHVVLESYKAPWIRFWVVHCDDVIVVSLFSTIQASIRADCNRDIPELT